MHCLAFLLELRDSVEQNFLGAHDFFFERIDDDRRLIDFGLSDDLESFGVPSRLHEREEPSFEEQLNTVKQGKREEINGCWLVSLLSYCCIAIDIFDSIHTLSIIFMLFSTLAGNDRISYATDRNVRVLENLLNIFIRSKINTNPVDRLSVAKIPSDWLSMVLLSFRCLW